MSKTSEALCGPAAGSRGIFIFGNWNWNETMCVWRSAVLGPLKALKRRTKISSGNENRKQSQTQQRAEVAQLIHAEVHWHLIADWANSGQESRFPVAVPIFSHRPTPLDALNTQCAEAELTELSGVSTWGTRDQGPDPGLSPAPRSFSRCVLASRPDGLQEWRRV